MRRAERSAPGLAPDAEVIAGCWADPGQFAVRCAARRTGQPAPADRDVLILIAWEQLSYGEAAGRGVPVHGRHPGFTVVPNAADAADRHGIGISWPVADGQVADPGYTAMIIFNPRTGAFLGQRTTYRGESPAVYSGDAVVQRAVVDQPGQLPLGGPAR
jgi:hypothetical protein